MQSIRLKEYDRVNRYTAEANQSLSGSQNGQHPKKQPILNNWNMAVQNTIPLRISEEETVSEKKPDRFLESGTEDVR